VHSVKLFSVQSLIYNRTFNHRFFCYNLLENDVGERTMLNETSLYFCCGPKHI